ncbi:MAG: Flp pilus assembly complex ATPase component TadA [Deltaproteobacteria bacterium]|nr:Flp pilus assembly complex ATPase component TadA [Deltaproteobacteria bacterium]
MHKIEIVAPGSAPRILDSKPQMIIGRDAKSDICLPSKAVSGKHAKILISNGSLAIEDLGSTNGTFLNDERLTGRQELQPDDEVRIGEFRLRVLQPANDESTESLDNGAYDPFRYVRPFLEPIQNHLDDETVTEIMINAPNEIFIERAGRVVRVPESFKNEKALVAAAKNIGRAVGRDISRQKPIMDARLADGSRVSAVIAPCALSGAVISIRKFFRKKLSMDKLIEFGSISPEAVEFLRTCVILKKNIIVSGGTGSGKTSLLNAISSMIPNDERILVIEDSAELQLQKEHLVRLESRPADERGKGDISIGDLVIASLRLRPDRIVIGEIRGGEAFDLLQAMNTGHGGSMSTVHSNSPVDTLTRLETTTLMSDVKIPSYTVKRQITSTIDLVVHTSRMRDGSRKVTHISEVVGLDADGGYIVEDLMRFQISVNSNDRVEGYHEFDQSRPSFLEEIHASGLPVPSVVSS